MSTQHGWPLAPLQPAWFKTQGRRSSLGSEYGEVVARIKNDPIASLDSTFAVDNTEFSAVFQHMARGHPDPLADRERCAGTIAFATFLNPDNRVVSRGRR